MIPFNQPSFVGRELEYITETIERGQLSGDGHFTKLCNDLIVHHSGARKALLTHSCTAALEMAAVLADIQPGDEVIMPSFTFVSTANAVVLRGGIPVFVDIERQSLNIDPSEVVKAITDRTKAIFAVHYAGVIADMTALADIARTHGLILVEDAAQALGSTLQGQKAGSLGDLAAFSFHETKNIISGEGGALTINRADLEERAEIIREKGTNRSRFLRGQVDKYTWVDVGSSFLPGELIAAFLYGQLENVGSVTQRRLELCNRYRDAFDPLGQAERVCLPFLGANRESNGHMFYLLMRDMDDRQSFIAQMRHHDIVAPFHYVPLHSSPAGMRFSRAVGDMNVTNDISARLVRLPLYVSLSNAQQDTIIDVALEHLRAS